MDFAVANCCPHTYVGWWLAVVDNKVGWVPSSYLEPLEGETEECVEETSDDLVIPAGEDTESGECVCVFY